MNHVADPVVTTMDYRVGRYEEPFRHYRVDWRKTTARTDTPDLLALFTEIIEWSAAQRMVDAETLAAHADLAEASFRTFPED